MFKDHKEGRASRPVVTGCNSNTRGFSNSVSDLLESVNKANQETYESISVEDMLAKVERYNIETEKIMKEGKDKISRKMMCKKKNEIQILARCDRLWEEKSRKSRQAGSAGDEPLAAEPENENRCEA